MTAFPTNVADAVMADGEFRAGATDLSERRRSGVSDGPLVDIGWLPDLERIEWTPDGAARIGALVTVATIAGEDAIRAAYPGLAAAADGLATPQVRAVGTIGGNLAQRNRCWYFRNPAIRCFKKGGDSCPARPGNHRHGVCIDLGPCVWPHPSTLAVALLAYGATIEITGRSGISDRPVAALFDGADPHRDVQLTAGELITSVTLPPPVAGERAAYFRAIERTYAEWPLVEAVVRLVIDNDTVCLARVAVGGVANIPLRLAAVEDALVGFPPGDAAVALAAPRPTEDLPQSYYKGRLLRATLTETIRRAVA